MPTKEEALNYVREIARQDVASMEEVKTAYYSAKYSTSKEQITDENDENKPGPAKTGIAHKIGITEILSYMGGGIIFLGIVILVGQHWDELNFIARLLVTLGSGIVAYVIGVFLIRDDKTEMMANPFFLISALVIPVGLIVVFDEAGFSSDALMMQSLMSVTCLVMFLFSYFLLHKNIFMFFSIIFGTWFFFSVTSLFFGDDILSNGDFYWYRFFTVGIAYILLGRSFSMGNLAPLSGILYGFGSLSLLGSALMLGGWKPEQKPFWELIYPLLVFGILYLSVMVKSDAFLVWGSVFLMIYIIKITSEYFSEGMGWSLSLIIAGLAMIGVGFMSLYLKRNYINNKNET